MSDSKTHLPIRAQASPNDPNTMRFVLEDDVLAGAVATFPDPPSAAGAPLAAALFAISGVRQVHVSGTVITVVKASDGAWAELKRPIAAALRATLAQPIPALGSAARAVGQPRNDAAIRAAVQTVLDSQANPAIARHGGHVAVTDVRDAVVSLRMSGGCQGCAVSSVTLRDGVERMIRAAVPEVRAIIDVTDHAAGQTPYYSGETDGGQARTSAVLYRPVPPDAIAQVDGQFSVSPDYLAPYFGTDAPGLLAALRSGEVVSMAESGTGVNAGKTLLIVRSSQRAWAAEITATGDAYEIPPLHAPAEVATTGSSLSDRVRAHLAALPAHKVPITYGQLARALGLYMPGSVRKVTQALEATMVEDAKAGSPFIASLVVSRAGGGCPGKGYFDQARSVGRGPAPEEDEASFHGRELKAVMATLKANP